MTFLITSMADDYYGLGTLPWLMDYVQKKEYELPQIVAIRKIAEKWKEDPYILFWLMSCAQTHRNYYVRVESLKSMLGFSGSNREISNCALSIINEDDNGTVRVAAVSVLSVSGREYENTYLSLKKIAIQDYDNGVRQVALRELARGWKERNDTLSLLISIASGEQDFSIKEAALREIIKVWEDKIPLEFLCQTTRELITLSSGRIFFGEEPVYEAALRVLMKYHPECRETVDLLELASRKKSEHYSNYDDIPF